MADAETENRTGQLNQYRVLAAGILKRRKKLSLAKRELGQALIMTENERVIRSFLEGGSDIEALLLDLKNNNISEAYRNDLLSAFASHHRKSGKTAVATERPVIINKAITSLQPNEIQILEALGKALTDKEIAQKLKFTLHTVRSYLKEIYRKLDVLSLIHN